MITKITVTSSYIKIETNTNNYIIEGELLVDGFLAYFDTARYLNSFEKNEISELEKKKLKNDLLKYNEGKELKIQIQEPQKNIKKSKAWLTLDRTIKETNNFISQKNSILNYKDILRQLHTIQNALIMDPDTRSLNDITLNQYAKITMEENPEYSKMLSDSFGITSLMKYNKL
ncbi:MAG: hypothetical protein ACTIJ9_11415 [Aequorivita sp.]